MDINYPRHIYEKKENPLEVNIFDEDPWNKKFRISASQNVRYRKLDKHVYGNQYNSYIHEPYNHIIGSIKGDPLKISIFYLNYGHKTMGYILCKYINAEKRNIIKRDTKQKLTAIKYQNEKGIHGLRNHKSTMDELFENLVVCR